VHRGFLISGPPGAKLGGHTAEPGLTTEKESRVVPKYNSQNYINFKILILLSVLCFRG